MASQNLSLRPAVYRPACHCPRRAQNAGILPSRSRSASTDRTPVGFRGNFLFGQGQQSRLRVGRVEPQHQCTAARDAWRNYVRIGPDRRRLVRPLSSASIDHDTSGGPDRHESQGRHQQVRSHDLPFAPRHQSHQISRARYQTAAAASNGKAQNSRRPLPPAASVIFGV